MEQTQDLYKTRGYSDDLLPKSDTQRNWKTFNYFTLWMGSVPGRDRERFITNIKS